LPLGAARDGLIAAQARLIVTLARNADLEQRNAGHEAQAGEMEELLAREWAVLHIDVTRVIISAYLFREIWR
jgi:hypothetical protein